MKAYKVEILVVDHCHDGADQIEYILESVDEFATVISIKEADIGEWSDDHLPNLKSSMKEEFNRLFN
jgi:hypothetical protein